jgi:tetratricopeptide (TPR) repeat protein
MNARGTRLVGLNLRPGRAAKARKEAGLSLRALAGGQLSATAVHLIEQGRSRPTLPTLRLIAERTGKPIEYFLAPEQRESLDRELQREQQTALEQVEVALSQERFADAVAMVAEMLDHLGTSRDRALAQFYSAQAHIRLAQPELARPLLAIARSYFESQKDELLIVECMDWYAAILHVEQDPEALPAARQALRLASELRPPPTRTLVRIWGRIGAISVSQYKWKDAIDAYGKAVQIGGELLDLSRVAKMYNDLSIAYRRMNRLDEARRYAFKAVEVHELLNDHLSIARAETNLALVLLRDARPHDAEQRLARALGIFRDAGQKHGRSNIHLALSETALTQGNLGEATEQANEALAVAEPLNEWPSLAEAHELLGRISAARKDWTGFDREFETAIAMLRDLGIPERNARIHALYASLLEKRGDDMKARLHWRQAVEAEHPEFAHDLQVAPTPVSASAPRAGKGSKSA